jgi:ATP-binding cassette, subfamily F, member 3
MSVVIQAAGLSHLYGGNQVFADLSFELHEGDRVAVIGENGVGKSTLFRILARDLQPHAGVVTYKRNLLVGYLTQDFLLPPNLTLLESVSGSGVELPVLEQHMRALEHRMTTAVQDDLAAVFEQYAVCQERYEALDGYGHAAKVSAVLTGLGIVEERWERPVGVLSGGEKKMVGLARLLIDEPDVLLLDEPDNHLDLAGKAWLESYVTNHKGAVALISHDRYFLDRAVNRLFELEDGTVHDYRGAYSAYLVEKRERLLRQEQLYDLRQRELKQLKRSAERLTVWAKQNAKFARRAQNRWRMLAVQQAALDATPVPVVNRKRIRVDLESRRGAARVVEMRGVAREIDGQALIRPFDLVVAHGERIGIVGANGAGKTTLFRMILGREEPTTGTARLGPTIRAGYYAQEHETLDPEATPISIVRALKPMTEEKALAFLCGMLFDRDDCVTLVHKLSGGERSRLQIAMLMLDGVNLLMLDEPTNNLDIPSCEELESALLRYEGTIVTISHDRYFLDKVVDRIIEIDEGMVRDYPGNFSFYDQHRGHGTELTIRTPSPVAKRAGIR